MNYKRMDLDWRPCFIHDSILPVAFIIGDSQNQDKMCGDIWLMKNVPSMCRACDVTPDNSDNPYHACIFLSMSDINAKCQLALGLYEPEEYGFEQNY